MQTNVFVLTLLMPPVFSYSQFTSAKADSTRMKELIESSQIPSCFGGTSPSLAEAASSANVESPGPRSTMVVINKKAEYIYNFELKDASQLTLTVYEMQNRDYRSSVPWRH